MAETPKNCSNNVQQGLEEVQQSNASTEDFIGLTKIGKNQFAVKVRNQVYNNIEDLKNYIQHERDILKKSNLEDIGRIKKLYELGLRMCSTDYVFHRDFVKFCKENGFYAAAPKAIDKMLKLFSDKPEAWQVASEWYCYIKHYQTAMKILKKGVEHNPESTLLYDRIIDMDLLHISASNGKEELLCGPLANLNETADLISTNIKNSEYFILFLKKLDKHDSTHDIQAKIVEHMYKCHFTEETVWHMMAQRERVGIHFDVGFNLEYEVFSDHPKLMYCMGKYNLGLQIVKNEKKRNLWFLCINTIIEFRNANKSDKDLSIRLLALLLHYLNKAHRTNFLLEPHYKLWTTLISDNDARRILQEATDVHPKSEELWKLRLKYAILSENIPLINCVFYTGVEELKEKSLDLWLILLKYFQVIREDSTIIWIFQDGIKQPPEISNVLKPKYIYWLAFNTSIEQARENYRIIAKQPPFCKELHKVMSRLELSQANFSAKRWREVHIFAYQQFGATDVDAGINYIKFLLYIKPEGYETKIKEIHKEVKEKLRAPLWPEFSAAYEKLMGK